MGGSICTARKRCVDNGDGTATVKLSQGYEALIASAIDAAIEHDRIAIEILGGSNASLGLLASLAEVAS